VLKSLASVAAKFFGTDVIVIDSLILCKNQTKECTGNQKHSVPAQVPPPRHSTDQKSSKIHGAASRARKRSVGGEITLEAFPLVPWATCRNSSAGSTPIPYEILMSTLLLSKHRQSIL
jgi:hypothetical protein